MAGLIWLIDYLPFYVLLKTFSPIWETSPLPVKDCKLKVYVQRYSGVPYSGPLGREGSLSCHTCCATGPHFSLSHPKDRSIQSRFTTGKRVWRTYSNPDPHGVGQVKVMTLCPVCVMAGLRYKPGCYQIVSRLCYGRDKVDYSIAKHLATWNKSHGSLDITLTQFFCAVELVNYLCL
jgi:hypothetical protein